MVEILVIIGKFVNKKNDHGRLFGTIHKFMHE